MKFNERSSLMEPYGPGMVLALLNAAQMQFQMFRRTFAEFRWKKQSRCQLHNRFEAVEETKNDERHIVFGAYCFRET